MRGENAELGVFFGLWGVVGLVLFAFMAVEGGGQLGRPMSAVEAEALQMASGSKESFNPIAVSWTGSWRVAEVQGAKSNQDWRSLDITLIRRGAGDLYLVMTDSGPDWVIKSRGKEAFQWAVSWMILDQGRQKQSKQSLATKRE